MQHLDLSLDDYPDLLVETFVSQFAAPLGDIPSPAATTALLRHDADTPFQPDETLRTDIRDLLRHGGYKPTGRGKPASEYLVRAAAGDALGSINAAVDACNAASLHGGFPISVIDLDRTDPPLRISAAPPGSSYVFNSAGQEIDVTGLLCIHDANGPCANPVKDAHRTKTSDATTRTLSVVWGTRAHSARLAGVAAFYRALVERAGARVDIVHPVRA